MKLLCNCLCNCFSNIFCCKNKIAEINPPIIRRDNKPEFVNENEENYKNEENEIYFKYIKFKDIDTKKHTYINYDDFDYNQPLPEIPQQLHRTIPLKIKQEIIYNTNLIFSNTEEDIQLPPLPPKVKRNTKSSILFH